MQQGWGKHGWRQDLGEDFQKRNNISRNLQLGQFNQMYFPQTGEPRCMCHRFCPLGTSHERGMPRMPQVSQSMQKNVARWHREVDHIPEQETSLYEFMRTYESMQHARKENGQLGGDKRSQPICSMFYKHGLCTAFRRQLMSLFFILWVVGHTTVFWTDKW